MIPQCLSTVYLMLLLLVMMLRTIECKQEWEKQPEYAEVNPGDSVVLTCVIDNLAGDCRWEKEGVPTGIFSGKYEWAGDVSTGDCSLLIKDAEVEYDNGAWKCSVTASSFKARDALVSSVSQLVVRVAPTDIVIKHSDTDKVVATNDTLDVLENTNITLECSSVNGKPPPKLAWQLPQSLPSFSLTESTKDGATVSIISALVMRSDRGKTVQCHATHSALSRPLSAKVNINVLYVPIVEVEYSHPNGLVKSNFNGGHKVSLKEGDSVIIRCKPDSNPPAAVAWRRAGERGVWSTEPEVLIENVGRETAGIYTCTAHNTLGVSGPKEIVMDVEYSPHITAMEPSGAVSSLVGGKVILHCLADANPEPAYQWVQRLNDQVVIKGNARVLSLENLIFEDDGEYICTAHNIIRGEEKITQSAPVQLTITGPPRLYLDPKTRFETAAGSDTAMEVKVCGEPRPEVRWQVDHLVLTAGSAHGRFQADTLVKMSSHHNCYISRLGVQEAHREDSKSYQVHVENIHGSETHSLELLVQENRQLEVLIAVAVGGVLTILTILLIIIYMLVSRDTCCSAIKHPSQRSDLSEMGSDKTDLESPDSSIITSSANHIFYQDARHDSSFHTFNKKQRVLSPGISCGAYSVTHGSISSISPHKHHNQDFSDCHRLGKNLEEGSNQEEGSRIARNLEEGPRLGRNMEECSRLGRSLEDGTNLGRSNKRRQLPPAPDLSGVSYYRYN